MFFFSPPLVEAFRAMNLPLRAAFTAVHKSGYVTSPLCEVFFFFALCLSTMGLDVVPFKKARGSPALLILDFCFTVLGCEVGLPSPPLAEADLRTQAQEQLRAGPTGVEHASCSWI